jgi:hypothetical protein
LGAITKTLELEYGVEKNSFGGKLKITGKDTMEIRGLTTRMSPLNAMPLYYFATFFISIVTVSRVEVFVEYGDHFFSQ